MPAEFIGLVRFGVDANCPCSNPADLVVVRAIKVHHGWQGYSSGVDDTFDAYLTLTPGTGFSGETARTIDPLTGLSTGTVLTHTPGYAADGDCTFAAFHGSYDDSGEPYETHVGEIALSAAYSFADVKDDCDDILFASGSHPVGFAAETYNLARRRETDTGFAGYGGLPLYESWTGVYTERERFASETPETYWGGSTVDGAIQWDETTDLISPRQSGDETYLVTGWARMDYYFRERAVIPLTGFYSTRTVVQVEAGPGWTDLETSSKTYFRTTSSYILVASPHLDASWELEGDLGGGSSLEVRVLFIVEANDNPPEGTPYTESSTAGQGGFAAGC